MRTIFAGLVVTALSVTAAAAQTPNFSGTWVVDQAMTSEAARQRMEASGGVATGGGGRGGISNVAGGTMRSAGGSDTGTVAIAGGGGGGRGGIMSGAAVSTDMVITLDASNFVIDVGGRSTTYALNGSETVAGTARSRAAWEGSHLVITTERQLADRSITSKTSWYLEGDVLVRDSGSKTFYRRK